MKMEVSIIYKTTDNINNNCLKWFYSKYLSEILINLM